MVYDLVLAPIRADRLGFRLFILVWLRYCFLSRTRDLNLFHFIPLKFALHAGKIGVQTIFYFNELKVIFVNY